MRIQTEIQGRGTHFHPLGIDGISDPCLSLNLFGDKTRPRCRQHIGIKQVLLVTDETAGLRG